MKNEDILHRRLTKFKPTSDRSLRTIAAALVLTVSLLAPAGVRAGTAISQKLTARTSGINMEVGAAAFGSSLALSSDGNTVLVGTPYDRYGVGSVSVFILKGTTWINQYTLYAPTSGADMEISAAGFGTSVALSADGNTALVGGPWDNSPTGSLDQESPGAGAVWVFIRNGTAWGQGQKLTVSASHFEKIGEELEIGQGLFGWSVALSADGDTALVGSPYDNPSFLVYPAGNGAAWVFIRKDTSWGSGQKLIALPSGAHKEKGAGDFGTSVALSSDGNTALVGTANDNNSVGSASVFIRNGTTWINQHTLYAPTSGADMEIGLGDFGTSVALSADGKTALVGGPGDNPINAPFDPGVGAAWVFNRNDNTWDGGQKLTAPSSGTEAEINSAQLGGSVALSSDGTTALIGGPHDNKMVGAAWAFDLQRSLIGSHSWVVVQKLTAPNTIAAFGTSVALSSDGNTALVGGPDAPDDDEAGAAWVFNTPPPPPIK
jgi:hypothetical protein